MKEYTLKNGVVTYDKRLDRIPEFDERSKEFPIRRLLEEEGKKKLRSYTWRCPVWLDQGRQGSCVGMAFAHEAAARPAMVEGINERFAVEKIYYPAQNIDPWAGGSYPGATPFYEGTSVLAGAKAARAAGLFDDFYWAFSLEDAILAIGYGGGGIAGFNWYQGMEAPDRNGFVHPTGRWLGGHAVYFNISRVNRKERYLAFHNSWGNSFEWKISFDDFEKLLHNNGEFCVPVNRNRINIAA